MFSALVVTLREGVEAALIVGITLVYLAKIGRPDLRRTVYIALGAALLASVGGAVALSYLPITQDTFEGWVMLVAAVMVVGMIIFMMRTARKLKGEIESKVGSLAGAGSQWGLFAFVFLMVFREGIETVAILAGVSLNSTELMSFLGTLLGVALAVVFGVMFVKGSVRIDLRKFFRVTTVILFFVAAQLVISGLHELSETGFLPNSKREMAVIGPIVRNDFFFPVTMLALVALMILLEYRRRKPESSGGRDQSGRAQAGVDGAARTSLGHFGLHHGFPFHLHGDGRVHLCQGTSRFPGNGARFRSQREGQYSRRRPAAGRVAVLQRRRKRREGPFLSLPQAG